MMSRGLVDITDIPGQPAAPNLIMEVSVEYQLISTILHGLTFQKSFIA
jgi:hypothetical protein